MFALKCYTIGVYAASIAISFIDAVKLALRYVNYLYAFGMGQTVNP